MSFPNPLEMDQGDYTSKHDLEDMITIEKSLTVLTDHKMGACTLALQPSGGRTTHR